MPSPLSGVIYETFLRKLPEMLENVPLGIRRRMLFEHDDAPAHFQRIVRQYLNSAFSITCGYG